MVFRAVAAVPRIIRFIRQLRPSAIYVNTVTLPWWLLAARLAGVPTIAHLHEAEKNDSLLVRRALIAPLRLADVVILISESTRLAMIEADPGLAAKGRLIYNGVPTPPEEPTPAVAARPAPAGGGRPAVAPQGAASGAGGRGPAAGAGPAGRDRARRVGLRRLRVVRRAAPGSGPPGRTWPAR